MRRVLSCLAALLCTAVWLVVLCLPLPASVGLAEERYVCRWEEGEDCLDYASAYAALVGAGREGVLLAREGGRGTIAPTPAYRALYDLLMEGDFVSLLHPVTEGLTRIERAAVWRTFSARLWYAGEYFIWTGRGLAAVDRPPAGQYDAIVLFEHAPEAATLARLGVKSLDCREGVVPTPALLTGTRVEHVTVRSPYASEGGVVTMQTAGGRRIVSAVPVARSLTLPAADFADEGALLPCARLESLTLPFVGSALSAGGSGENGQFAHLFSTGEGYRVPDTLRRVKVTGGTLGYEAFYACPMLEEIDACALAPSALSQGAFLGATGLRELHAPRADLLLIGSFTREPLPCGCTRYLRTGE